MTDINEPLSESEIRAHLSSDVREWAREIRVHEEIDSTNTHLIKRAASQAIDGVVCLAEVQTSGRGRRGRTWLSPKGRNIAMSLGMNLAMPISSLSPLSLVVGIAAADTLKGLGIDAVSLKWPNDILIEATKAGGILIELASIANPLVVVIGLGVNVGSGAEIGDHLGIAVGDVLGAGRRVSRNELAAKLIDSIRRRVMQFEREGFGRLRDHWDQLHAHRNSVVTISTANESVEGVARGVTLNGELVLDTASGTLHFNGGEVSLRADVASG